MFNEDIGEVHSAIVDVTDRCNLRCKHCFYFREEHESQEMSAGEFLAGMRALKKKYNIMNMAWCGGEPLFRRDVLEEGCTYFPTNWLFTNGTLDIPDIENLMVFVSVDGPRHIHDDIRGKGTYDKIMSTLSRRPEGKPVVFLPTFHALNAPYLEEMIAELARVPNTFMGVEFFTPLTAYETVGGYAHIEVQRRLLEISWEERDRLIERLLALKKTYPGFIVVRDRVLELMTSKLAPMCIKKCNMSRRTLTLDLNLNRKFPCVLGKSVDCSRCGCIFPYEQQARAEAKEAGESISGFSL